MELLLWAERRKLRRSKILWIAGFATVMVALIVFAQGQFTFYESRYIDGAGWFMTAAQSLATFYVLPAVIALLGSYMICREEQEDTLKSLRLIPVDEVKLTLTKMVLALVFSVLIYFLLFAITFLVEAVLHFEALSIGLVWGNLKTYLLDGIGVNLFVRRAVRKYVRTAKDGISHDSRFQYLRLLRCEHGSGLNWYHSSAGLRWSGAVHSERAKQESKIILII